jgi:hypothetical protein
MGYIRNHWRGDQSLLWSLGINLVLIRTLVLYSDQFTLPPHIVERPDAIIATLVFSGLCHGVVYPWQIVGLLRACERQTNGINSGVWVWVSYCALVISFIFTLLALFGAYQSLSPEKFIVEDPLALQHARESQYSLNVGDDGSRIYVEGLLALGITDKLRDLLDQNPNVTGIVLKSDGGQVYEGRGAAHLFKQRNLTTFVFETCNSACATAFIGGVKRLIGPSAKLGFHEYGLELWYPIPLFNLKEEQQKELAFYRLQNIDEDFLKRAFSSPHKDIWYPPHDELVKAGIVHQITDN